MRLMHASSPLGTDHDVQLNIHEAVQSKSTGQASIFATTFARSQQSAPMRFVQPVSESALTGVDPTGTTAYDTDGSAPTESHEMIIRSQTQSHI